MTKIDDNDDEGSPKQFASDYDLTKIPDEDWAIARKRREIIDPLVMLPDRTREDVERVAKENGISYSTVYRYLGAFEESQTLDCLLPESPGPKKGSTRLTAKQEEIINEGIEKYWLTKKRLAMPKMLEKVALLFDAAGVKAPHKNTVRARLTTIDQVLELKRRGYKEELHQYHPIRGRFPNADHPYAVVQIDHTPLDLIVIDENTGKTIDRPWITVVIDVFSRMVAGYYIGEEHPSAMSAGLALSHAILSKAATLAEYGIPVAWPAEGFMVVIHADNAREFRGAMLQKACDKHGMTLKLRPVKTPHYGGHIERLCGTLNAAIHTLPGTTFSNPNARSGYNSSAEAAMTLSDLKHWFVKYVVEDYHNREHSETKLTPLQKWRHGMMRIGELRQPKNPDVLRIDLMPFVHRTVQAYGFVINDICYYDEVMRPLINRIDPETRKKVKLLLHYDPRDKSRLYAWMPNIGAYHVIPFRDTRHPPVSEKDLREARALSKSRGEEPTEANIFKTRRELDAIAERAVDRKKSARKTVNRNNLAKDLAAKAPIGPLNLLLPPPPEDPQPAPATPTEVLTYDDIGFFPTED